MNSINILPMAMKIAAKTIGHDLVTVIPISQNYMSSSNLEKIKNEVKSINRNSKIDSILKGATYKKMEINDHPDYIKNSNQLLYFDVKYGEATSTK